MYYSNGLVVRYVEEDNDTYLIVGYYYYYLKG